MNDINVEEPCLEQEEVRKIIRLWAPSESKATFKTHRRNLLWNESKYLEAITKSSNSLKRKASEANTSSVAVALDF